MNLAQLVEQDNAHLIEDTVTGMAHDITLTPQVGSPISLAGLFVRASMSTDPISGQKFAQARAALTLRSSRIAAVTLDESWTVSVSLGGAVVYTGRPLQVLPDTTLGCTLITLEGAEA